MLNFLSWLLMQFCILFLWIHRLYSSLWSKQIVIGLGHSMFWTPSYTRRPMSNSLVLARHRRCTRRWRSRARFWRRSPRRFPRRPKESGTNCSWWTRSRRRTTPATQTPWVPATRPTRPFVRCVVLGIFFSGFWVFSRLVCGSRMRMCVT